jgi:hypothetical protein
MLRAIVCAAVALGAGVSCNGRERTELADDAGALPGEPTTDDAAAASLCGKYGGPASVHTIVAEHVLGRIAADCRIGGFFAGLTPAGMIRVRDCLSLQVQELMGCSGVVYAGSFASNGLECRDMHKAHIGLRIGAADFDALIEDVVAGLDQGGMDSADIEAAAPALLALRSTIVETGAAGTTRDSCSDEPTIAGDDTP